MSKRNSNKIVKAGKKVATERKPTNGKGRSKKFFW